MMKRSLSILLSFILLASHMSFTIGTHYCGGEAIESNIIIGEAHLGCGMMVTEDSCADSENANLSGDNFDLSPCCKNEYQPVQSIYEFLEIAAYASFNVDFAAAIVYTTLNLELFPKSIHKHFTEYKSPPIEKDIQDLFQTYLI
jgi:hypothetical protein